MSVAEQIPVEESKTPKGRTGKRNGRWAGYRHLLKARMLELKREPEVVFWVFVFPLLLASGLGIAFRNKPADSSSVAIVSGAEHRKRKRCCAVQWRSAHSRSIVKDEAEAAQRAFAWGNTIVVIEPEGTGGVRYRYDPARPESVLARIGGGCSTAGCGGTQGRSRDQRNRQLPSPVPAISIF